MARIQLYPTHHAHGGVCRVKGSCILGAHTPSPGPHSEYLGFQGSQVRQPQPFFQYLCNTASQDPSASGWTILECSSRSLQGWVYTVERKAHTGACRIKPWREGADLRPRTRAFPHATIFQHRSLRRPRILIQSCLPKLLGKHAPRYWLNLEGAIVSDYFLCIFLLHFLCL